MSDLISKGALFNALANAHDKSEIFAIINNAPTVDAEPVRHGHWIRHDDELLGLTDECSECHCEGMVHGNYCPNCGCKMNEVNE